MTSDTDALGEWLIRRLDSVGGAEPPEPDLVVAYVEGRLSDEERPLLEARLAESDEGRALLAALVDAGGTEARAQDAPPARGRLLQFSLMAVAAIVLVVLGLGAFGLLEGTGQPETEKLLAKAFTRAQREMPDDFGDLSPLSAAELRATGPGAERGGITLWEPAFVVTGVGGFRWEPVAGAKSYRLRLTDEQGRLIYETTTTEPVHTVPPDAVRVYPGKVYVWDVAVESPASPAKGRKSFRAAEIEAARRHTRTSRLLRKAAGVRFGRLAEAHLAVRFELWTEARILAQAYVRDNPEDEAGRALLDRIHRQLGMR